MGAIAALGMCIAVKQQCVSPQYACDTLFQPSFLHRIRANGAESALCDLIESALELEDVAALAPAGLDELLNNTIAGLLEYLKDLGTSEVHSFCNWTSE